MSSSPEEFPQEQTCVSSPPCPHSGLAAPSTHKAPVSEPALWVCPQSVPPISLPPVDLFVQLCFPVLDHGMKWQPLPLGYLPRYPRCPQHSTGNCLVFFLPSADVPSWEAPSLLHLSGDVEQQSSLLPVFPFVGIFSINTSHSLEIAQVGVCQIVVPWKLIPVFTPSSSHSRQFWIESPHTSKHLQC